MGIWDSRSILDGYKLIQDGLIMTVSSYKLENNDKLKMWKTCGINVKKQNILKMHFQKCGKKTAFQKCENNVENI